jgi:hydroxypyruvate isomerase
MPRFNANLSMLFTEVPFLQRFARARKAGFEAVEFLFPYEFEKHAVKQALSENGLKQALFNLPSGDWAAGERGLAILPDRVEEFRRGVASAIEYAEALGCRQINCLSGVVPEGGESEVLHATFVANLRYAAGELKKHGIRLLVEPINHYDIPGFFLNTVEQADAIINEVGSDNLFIQ